MNIKEAEQIIRAAALADDSVLLEGVHGIGKSQIVEQFAENEDYHLEILFLSHQEVGDLIGIPHKVEQDGTYITTWTIPIWLQRMNKAAEQGKRCVLFLDELNRAPIDVRQTALQLVLEKKIHEHTLPIVNGQKSVLVAAINPADDYQVEELDTALLDRFLAVTVEAHLPTWLEYANKRNVNRVIPDFLMENANRLHWTPADGGTGTSPRSWTKLADYFDHISDIPEEILFQVIKGKIGTEVGTQFYTFFKNYVDVVKIQDVEDLVNANVDEVGTIEELGQMISDLMVKSEAIQKSEMAQLLKEKYIDSENMLPFHAFLYSLEMELCVAFLKGLSADDHKSYVKLVKADEELNNKELFRKIFIASNKK